MPMRDIDIPRSQIEILIDEWIFSERDRLILRRRLLDGICYEPLAEEFGLSVRHIKTIVYKGEDKLFSKLEKMH
jgi:DNA-directed RNA polymerase specialized sigma24 family protein